MSTPRIPLLLVISVLANLTVGQYFCPGTVAPVFSSLEQVFDHCDCDGPYSIVNGLKSPSTCVYKGPQAESVSLPYEMCANVCSSSPCVDDLQPGRHVGLPWCACNDYDGMCRTNASPVVALTAATSKLVENSAYLVPINVLDSGNEGSALLNAAPASAMRAKVVGDVKAVNVTDQLAPVKRAFVMQPDSGISIGPPNNPAVSPLVLASPETTIVMHFKIHGDKPVPGELVLLAKQHAAQNRNAEAGELRIVATVDDDGFRLHATTSYFPGTYYNVTRHCSASLQFGRWYQLYVTLGRGGSLAQIEEDPTPSTNACGPIVCSMDLGVFHGLQDNAEPWVVNMDTSSLSNAFNINNNILGQTLWYFGGLFVWNKQAYLPELVPQMRAFYFHDACPGQSARITDQAKEGLHQLFFSAKLLLNPEQTTVYACVQRDMIVCEGITSTEATTTTTTTTEEAHRTTTTAVEHPSTTASTAAKDSPRTTRTTTRASNTASASSTTATSAARPGDTLHTSTTTTIVSATTTLYLASTSPTSRTSSLTTGGGVLTTTVSTASGEAASSSGGVSTNVAIGVAVGSLAIVVLLLILIARRRRSSRKQVPRPHNLVCDGNSAFIGMKTNPLYAPSATGPPPPPSVEARGLAHNPSYARRGRDDADPAAGFVFDLADNPAYASARAPVALSNVDPARVAQGASYIVPGASTAQPGQEQPHNDFGSPLPGYCSLGTAAPASTSYSPLQRAHGHQAAPLTYAVPSAGSSAEGASSQSDGTYQTLRTTKSGKESGGNLVSGQQWYSTLNHERGDGAADDNYSVLDPPGRAAVPHTPATYSSLTRGNPNTDV